MRTAKFGPGLRLLARRLLGLLIIFPNEDRNIWLEATSSPGRFSLALAPKAREKRPGDEVGLEVVY